MIHLRRNAPLFALTLFALSFFACSGKNPVEEKTGIAIGVFIPGIMSGSPVYEMLAQGVEEGAAAHNAAQENQATVTIIEGGFNQAEWETKVTSMTASGSYDLIVSSNPSLPDIVSRVSARFPAQRFLLLDGELAGNPRVYTLRYNQREQAYMAGHIAALETEELSAKAGGGETRRIGLVAAQEYPVMNNIILPGFLEGAQAVDPGYTVDFRIVGNWFDAARAADLAADMIEGGVRVLLCIAGKANEGVVNAAAQKGAKVVWFDTNGYQIQPGTVIGSSVLYQNTAAREQVLRYLENKLPFGTVEILGVNDGYVDFIEDDPLDLQSVSPEVREKQAAMIARIRSGELRLEPRVP